MGPTAQALRATKPQQIKVQLITHTQHQKKVQAARQQAVLQEEAQAKALQSQLRVRGAIRLPLHQVQVVRVQAARVQVAAVVRGAIRLPLHRVRAAQVQVAAVVREAVVPAEVPEAARQIQTKEVKEVGGRI